MLTQYAFSILFIDKKKAKFSNDRFGLIAVDNQDVMRACLFRLTVKTLLLRAKTSLLVCLIFQ